MKDFFDRAPDIEACTQCVKKATERDRKLGGYTWYSALEGWADGCRICYEIIEFARFGKKVSKGTA